MSRRRSKRPALRSRRVHLPPRKPFTALRLACGWIRRSSRVTGFPTITARPALTATTAQDLSGAHFRKQAFRSRERARQASGRSRYQSRATNALNTAHLFSSTASATSVSLPMTKVSITHLQAKELPIRRSRVTGQNGSSASDD